ncbi:uncharacterized protein LOC144628821 [Oculina patagonica]
MNLQSLIYFEKALWNCLKEVLPDVTVKGCVFHWTQALWRKIQDLGLQASYQSDDGTFKYLRKIMALPFLPASEIPAMFTRLKVEATTEPLQKFVEYVDNTWIQSTTWPPSCWSVYKKQIRTNNDVEGWHNGLNRRASGRAQMPLYMLIHLLHKEACLVALQIRLVSEGKLTKLQKKKYRSVQAKILSYWEQYANHQRSAVQLLKACSHVNGPIVKN